MITESQKTATPENLKWFIQSSNSSKKSQITPECLPLFNLSGETRTTKTLIDHVSTNRPNYVPLAGVIKIGITDHYMVYCIQKLNTKSRTCKLQNKTEYRSLKNYDKKAFLSDLRTIDWERAMSASQGDPNKMVNDFYDLFCSVLDVHAPINKGKEFGCVHLPLGSPPLSRNWWRREIGLKGRPKKIIPFGQNIKA